MLSGTPMLFEHEAGEALLASLQKIRTKAPREVAAAAREFGIAADAKDLAGMLTPDRLLAQAAFMFTNAWLDAALRAAQGRDRPELLGAAQFLRPGEIDASAPSDERTCPARPPDAFAEAVYRPCMVSSLLVVCSTRRPGRRW